MDSYHNSPQLTYFLKENNTDCIGTQRIIGKKKVEKKSFRKIELKKGDSCAIYSGKVTLMKWHNKKINPLFLLATVVV